MCSLLGNEEQNQEDLRGRCPHRHARGCHQKLLPTVWRGGWVWLVHMEVAGNNVCVIDRGGCPGN